MRRCVHVVCAVHLALVTLAGCGGGSLVTTNTDASTQGAASSSGANGTSSTSSSNGSAVTCSGGTCALAGGSSSGGFDQSSGGGSSSGGSGGSSDSGSGGTASGGSSGSGFDASINGPYDPCAGKTGDGGGSCGTTCQPCCPGDQCQNTGLWCVARVCSPCGGVGQPCCGNTCKAGNICIAVGATATCSACGAPGEIACGTMPQCTSLDDEVIPLGPLDYCINNLSTAQTGQPGERCATSCVDAKHACYTPPSSGNGSGLCVVCGGLDNPCCGTACGGGLTCKGGLCQ